MKYGIHQCHLINSLKKKSQNVLVCLHKDQCSSLVDMAIGLINQTHYSYPLTNPRVSV